MTELLIGHIEAMAELAPVWGFFLIFFFMTIESSFIPFPSEVVMIPAGFLAARGELSTGSPKVDLTISVLMGVLGSLAGAWVNYSLAKKVGQPFLLKYGKYFFLPPAALARAEQLFRDYGVGATGAGAGLWVIFLSALGYAAGLQATDMSYADLVHQGKATISENSVYIIPSALIGLAAYVGVSKFIMKGKVEG
jgi:membrane protein DedA with SNARE-associated domain